MDMLSAAAALITLAALFSWLNHRFIRQPASIALLLFSVLLSLALVGLGKLGFDTERMALRALTGVKLDRVLLDSMLSFLLFAGALHVDLGEFERRKWAIGFLASLGGDLGGARRPRPAMDLRVRSAIPCRSSGACCSAR